MTSPLQIQLDELVTRCSENCKSRGIAVIDAAGDAARLQLLWLQYLTATKRTGTADCLLEGTKSAVHESTSCLALGLVRPSLNSLRLQIDLIFSWLYFKDHAVEWGRVQNTGDGFKLKQELLKYFGESFAGFGMRFGILKECKTRTQEDPYRLLSAHMHGQSQYALPQVQAPSDIVAPSQAQDEAIALQKECSEFITDVLWSIFADKWASLPTELLDTLKARFTEKQRVAFFTF
jgi:hypothetical protein